MTSMPQRDHGGIGDRGQGTGHGRQKHGRGWLHCFVVNTISMTSECELLTQASKSHGSKKQAYLTLPRLPKPDNTGF